MALSPGTRVGPYEVIAQIGAGGMGEVYQATDTNLKRGVAIKVLPEAVAADAERLARFQREAEVLATLNHPNIAAIYGLERSGITTAIAMELVEGPTLADRIMQGPIAVDEALAIARQIADALEAAHEQGIVHRDLKPANIKVRPDGVVKVLDFGLAKAAGPAAAMSVSSSMSPTITTPAMTQAGLILGTAAYMSPEQARGKPVDKRADIWAFGCVLYEMLTGRRAFEAEDVGLTLAEVMKSEPDWNALPQVPPSVRMYLRRCFKKDPRQRLRDIGEFRLAFDGIVADEIAVSVPPAPASTSGRVWTWLLPVALASAIAGAVMALSWPRPSSLPEVVRFEIHAPPGSKLPPGTPAVSPDGRWIAYTVTGADGVTRIHLREFGAIESRPLPDTEGGVHPFWSSDGRSIGFASGRVLRRIDLGAGSARDLVPQVGGPWHGAWNQFDDVLFTGGGGVLRVAAAGGATTPAVTLDAKAHEDSASFPFFLPDGRRFLVRVTSQTKSVIQLASLDSREKSVVVDDVLSAPLLAPTPGGPAYLLYLRDETLVAQEFDLQSGQVRGNTSVVVDHIGRVANPALQPTAGVSPRGVLAYQLGGDRTASKLTWFNRAGERVGEVALEMSATNSMLSPDGRFFAFEGDFRGDREIWVTDLARGVTSRLTRSPGADSIPLWSPDSRRVAYYRSGKMHVQSADGGSDETVLTEAEGFPRSWSPDGKYLLLDTPRRTMVLVPLDGGAPIPVGPRDGVTRNARFSPDGRYIAYTWDEQGRNEVFIQALPPGTARVKVSLNGGSLPRWSPTTRELFFVSAADRTLMAVDVQLGDTISVGVPRKLGVLSGSFDAVRGYDPAPDGQRFLVNQAAENLPDTPITVVLNWWVELARKSK